MASGIQPNDIQVSQDVGYDRLYTQPVTPMSSKGKRPRRLDENRPRHEPAPTPGVESGSSRDTAIEVLTIHFCFDSSHENPSALRGRRLRFEPRGTHIVALYGKTDVGHVDLANSSILETGGWMGKVIAVDGRNVCVHVG